MIKDSIMGKVKMVFAATTLGLGVVLPGLTEFAAADGGYTLTFTVKEGTEHTMVEEDGHLKIDGQFVDLRSGDDTIGEVNCGADSCTITVADGTSGVLNYYSAEKFTLYAAGQPYNMEVEFSADENILVQDYEDGGDPGPQGDFSGNVWFFWNCGGDFCKYKVENLTPAEFNAATSTTTYHTNYIDAATVVDNGRTPDVGKLKENEDYFWVWEDKGEGVSCASWAEFLEGIQSLSYDELREFAIDPTGAESGNDSISTNGDRAFRATIYRADSYYGISNASSIEDLTYYPDFWDEAFFNPAHDISGTTLAKPAVIQTYLLEPTIVLENDDISGEITGITVADDTPAAAVSITQDGGKWTIRFNSNYFDRTVFKVVSGTHEYFVRLARITVDQGGGVYVPETDEGNYEVQADITLKSGAKIFTTMNRDSGNDGSGGKGLAYFAYDLAAEDWGKIEMNPESEKSPTKVEYSVIREGSTDSHYAGTLAGSGEGTGYVRTEGGFVIENGEEE